MLLNIMTFTSQFMKHSCGRELNGNAIRIELGEVVGDIYYRVIEEVNGDDDEILIAHDKDEVREHGSIGNLIDRKSFNK